MNKTIKISLIFIIFLFLFSLKSFAYEVHYSTSQLNKDNIIFSDCSNFVEGDLYCYVYGSSSTYYHFYVFPLLVDLDNNNVILQYSYSSHINTSSFSFSFDFFNSDTIYFINGNKYLPNFSSLSPMNYKYKVSNGITFFDDNYIYQFLVTDINSNDSSYNGCISYSNDSVDFLVGSRLTLFQRYDLSNGSISNIYSGWTRFLGCYFQ